MLNNMMFLYTSTSEDIVGDPVWPLVTTKCRESFAAIFCWLHLMEKVLFYDFT